MSFMDKDFLLDSDLAKTLFHDYAENEPIFDFHNHLSAKDIANHRHFHNLYELWLETDHYKWRAMRGAGVDEKYITGDSEPYEKYEAFATIFPNLIGSPVYHWTLLELRRYFDIEDILNKDNCKEIWDKTCKIMEDESFSAPRLLEKVKVKECCTTDDPIDSLEYHQTIKTDKTISFNVRPSFRPDKYLDVNSKTWKQDCDALCKKYQTNDLKEALSKALDFFAENGCVVSDHGFLTFDYQNETFKDLINFLGKRYNELNIVMQLHIGPLRNNSYILMNTVGKDAGADSIGSVCDPVNLSKFFQELEKTDTLPKTILYNLNPADSAVFVTMAGNYAPRMQYGAPWWFNDTYRGMEEQIDYLCECYMISKTVGMLTDSRSFTSFVRHEYYRRILCNKLAKLVIEGKYPEDIKTLGDMVKNISYQNAVDFFVCEKGGNKR